MLEVTYVAGDPTNPPTNRERWIADFFQEGETVDFTADLDHDTLNGVFEYGFGFNPKVANDPSTGFSAVGLDQEIELEFLRDTRATDLTYRLESSSSLQEWTPFAESVAGADVISSGEGVTVVEVPVEPDSPMRRVAVTLRKTGERQFCRLVMVLGE